MPKSPEHVTEQENENGKWPKRRYILALTFLAVTVVGIYLCYRLALPFLPALVWALALAIVALPLHQFVERRIKNRSLAAGISAFLIAVVVLAPLVFVAREISQEVTRTAETMREEIAGGKWRERIERNPRAASAFRWVEQAGVNFQGAAEQIANSAPKHITNFFNSLVWFIVEFLITFLALFYFFRDREQILSVTRKFLPLGDSEADRVFKCAGDTIYATVYGTFVVALVQGVLGGLMFWWLGLPAPILWGAAMAVLGLIPFLGSFIVWLPASVFLAAEGSWGKALILLAWGGLVVALVDNLLYPVLVGDRLRMHSLPVFIAFIGGFLLFGATGIILGPLVLALTVTFFDVWRERFEKQAAAD